MRSRNRAVTKRPYRLNAPVTTELPNVGSVGSTTPVVPTLTSRGVYGVHTPCEPHASAINNVTTNPDTNEAASKPRRQSATVS